MEADGGAERVKRLYPFVDQTKTPLPSCWSVKDKFQYLGLTQNNLRVHYKGQGKTHKDAAAVRSDHPIPAACGLYYYEVRIISKGRDGFMGIGLSQHGVSLNRLPGWDKFSYGYHGDDGNSFCSSGSGAAYGPTFTTDDVIGCGLNFVDNTCFFTKNGHNIGVAFTDIPGGLYPTVGLQTPGEIIDTNFGLTPFVYDIAEDMREVQSRVLVSIERYLLSPSKSDWFVRLISGYLAHHGYCATAEAFGGQTTMEDVVSMKHRQNICKFIKCGRISEAIRQVQLLFPSLFDQKPELLFVLKCRQFVEMIAGNDGDIILRRPHSPASSPSQSQYKILSHLPPSKVRPSPLHSPRDSPRSSPRRIKSPRPYNFTPASSADLIDARHDRSHSRNGCHAHPPRSILDDPGGPAAAEENGNKATADNGNFENGAHAAAVPPTMLIDGQDEQPSNNQGDHYDQQHQDASTTDSSPSVSNGAGGSYNNGTKDTTAGGGVSTPADDLLSCSFHQQSRADPIERLIQFGRELHQMYTQLKQQGVLSVKNQRMLQDAISLMAYPDPWISPLSYQLQSAQREPVAAALNSAILELQGYPPKPALEIIFSHACRLREEMASHGLGSAAFANPTFYFLSLLSPTSSNVPF